jgi:hypothetical protein
MSDAADAFVFAFPAYLATRAAPGGGEEVVADRAAGREPYLPVFTNQDRADAFVATLPPGGMTTVVWDAEELTELVRQAAAGGVVHVGLDAGGGVRLIPADRFLSGIAGLPPGQPG